MIELYLLFFNGHEIYASSMLSSSEIHKEITLDVTKLVIKKLAVLSQPWIHNICDDLAIPAQGDVRQNLSIDMVGDL